MKDFPSLTEFLIEYGVNQETPKEKVEELKKTYQKSYHHYYYKLRKNREKRLETRLSFTEYRTLQKWAKRHKRKHLAPFLKEMAFAYLNETYIEKDPALTESLLLQIRRIGNNVNQVVQSMHSTRDYSNAKYYESLTSSIEEVRSEVKAFITAPPELSPVMVVKYLRKYIKERPEHYAFLRRFVDGLDPQLEKKETS